MTVGHFVVLLVPLLATSSPCVELSLRVLKRLTWFLGFGKFKLCVSTPRVYKREKYDKVGLAQGPGEPGE